MARDPRAPRAPRVRRARSATESLLSVTLVLESLLVFFVTLVVYSLSGLEPATVFTAGGALFLITLLTSRVLAKRWGLAIGWAIQAVLILSGILVPLMWFIGTGFTALWIFCFVTGQRLDRRNAAIRARFDSTPSSESN